MEKQIIARGLLSGAIAGLLAFLFARVFVEPVIERAIGYEEGLGELGDHGAHEHGVELFTRGVQANIGMGFGVLAFAIAMGGLFAVAYCSAYGRVGDVSPRALSVWLSGAMFVALYLVPFLKYPANPPAVSLDETIRQRTLLYLMVVVLSAALLVAAIVLARRLASRLGGWNAALVGAGSYIAAIAVVTLLLPTIDETPGPVRNDAGAIVYPAFPADDLYEFRLYSLGTQLVLWAAIGLVFAPMAQRLLGDRRQVASV